MWAPDPTAATPPPSPIGATNVSMVLNRLSSLFFNPTGSGSDSAVDQADVDDSSDADSDNQSNARTPTPNKNLCVICEAKPRYTKGKVSYETCGLSCAAILNTMCKVCRTKPKYEKNGRTYPACGLTCASKLSTPTKKAQGGLCTNCKRKPRVLHKGAVSLYCGKPCRDEMLKNLSSKMKQTSGTPKRRAHEPEPAPRSPRPPAMDNSWSALKNRASKHSPALLELPKSDNAFEKVYDLFRGDWKSSQRPEVTVHRIFKIYQRQEILARHEQFKRQLENEDESSVHETRRWIGVTHTCHLVKSGIVDPCQSLTCTLCDVVKRNVFSQMEFPRMIPAAGTSSKADKLAFPQSPVQKSGSHKAVVLAKVVSANEEEMTPEQAVTLESGGTTRRQGFIQLTRRDESASDSEKYSDQLLVFVPDAILPRYVVLYS